MTLDAEFLLKVKEHVTTKLKQLGAFIDEELPDYIMVMVANKKNESSMAKDLQLFLGEHTAEFTRWLHSTLEELKTPVKAAPVEKQQPSSRSKSRPQKRKPDKVRSASGSYGRSRSRSPVDQRKTDKLVASSREPHVEGELLHIHADENEFINDDISSTSPVYEERKVVSTSVLSSKESKLRESYETEEVDKVSTIRSVVRTAPTKQRSKVDRAAAKRLQPFGRLLQKAVTEARNEVQKHTSTNLSSGYGSRTEVSSTRQAADSTQFYVTLPGGRKKESTRTLSVPDSSVEVKWSPEKRIESDVKSRLGSRRMFPYSRPSKCSAKDRLGPIIQPQMSQVAPVIPDDDDVIYDTFDDQEDMVELIEGDLELSGSYPHQQDESLRVIEAGTTWPSKLRLADRLNQKQLVVTLNETDEDDDIAPLSSEKLATSKQKSKTSRVSTSTDNQVEQVHIPSHLERCKYWPKCRNGEQCPYIHPSEPCPTFPRCRLASSCTYIHPSCRFDASCTRLNCPFQHTTRRAIEQQQTISAVPSVNPSQVVCRFQNRCTNAICPFYHPPAPSFPRLLAVRPTIVSPAAVSTSPVPCRYGAACINRSTCPFLHADATRLDKFKWVAPSKQPSSDQPSKTNQSSSTGSTTTRSTALSV
ncbi:Zinc finger CCCH domain-containing protein 14 [Clonorchis sinensis]|uniref:Zinc finger CCCH domain-containing protein 14 n=1 Tax=Clonorchis sinensis TaxID=79923 RepID=A0A8T1MPU7_CLOSI|nr:Zinc finger CCCH domain-containing protein 14 [Clonorchis sinensis]